MLALEELKKYDSDELVEYFSNEFRKLARYNLPNDKRMHRFNFLMKVQSFFEICDLEIATKIIEALSRQAHGADYSYENVKITPPFNIHDKITVGCQVHGLFAVPFKEHLLGSDGNNTAPIGCHKCFEELRKSSGGYKKKNTAIFIQEAEAKHHEMFDYRHVRYIDATSKSRNKVTMICTECQTHGDPGIFERHPSEFLRNRDTGCPICRKRNWGARSREFLSRPSVREKIRESKYRAMSIYYMRITIGDKIFYKVGSTSQKLNVRMWQIGNNVDGVDIRLLGTRYFDSGTEGRAFEQLILNDPRVLEYRYKIGNNSNNRQTAESLTISHGDRELLTTDIRTIVPEHFGKIIQLDDYYSNLNQPSCFYYLKVLIGDKFIYRMGYTESSMLDVVRNMKHDNTNISSIDTILITKFSNNFSSILLVEYLLRISGVNTHLAEPQYKDICRNAGSELLTGKIGNPVNLTSNIFSMNSLTKLLKDMFACFVTDDEFSRIKSIIDPE